MGYRLVVEITDSGSKLLPSILIQNLCMLEQWVNDPKDQREPTAFFDDGCLTQLKEFSEHIGGSQNCTEWKIKVYEKEVADKIRDAVLDRKLNPEWFEIILNEPIYYWFKTLPISEL